MKRLLAEPGALTPLMAATAPSLPEQDSALARARAFAEPLLAGETLDTGENTFAHADAVAAILKTIGGSEAMQAASYLVYACDHLNKPQEVIAKAFGDNFAALALETTKLVQVQRQARQTQVASARASTAIPMAQTAAAQTENVRKMLLAFSRDLRVVMLRLASRLQTLRHFAATKLPLPAGLASEALQVFAPLANRLGIWEIKWEMEDLSFRFLEPDTYRQVAVLLDETRSEREDYVEQLRARLEAELKAQDLVATVQGRPKHIYSIVKKMRGKSLNYDQVYDIRALRIVVAGIPDCYAALSWVHSQFASVSEEFDDYIAKPKANGYQSLHTVVRDQAGQPIEIQIRTQAMHDHAEHGVAAHWAYKEAGAKGYAGVSASGAYDAKIAVLRQLLAWERDLSGAQQQGVFDDRIYVLTPEAAIVELPQGATAVDFAYSVHTNLGHRCRGARLDGVMVPLNTPLKNGQTVEVTVAKEGGPSRDWLNAELGFLVSHRAKAKVRAWFNALAVHETVAKGREAVEKLLQREGKTALKLEDLASKLGFNSADDLFEVVGKDEFSLRNIEILLRPPEPELPDAEPLLKKPRSAANPAKGGVLVVGVDSLMTQLAKCCKPAPPDAICGFVTRGKGVSVHRADCSNLREMVSKNGERVIEVQWGLPQAAVGAVYPVDVAVEAADRQGLLRDISEVFTKEKMNVIAVQTQSVKGTAWMTFTVEVSDSGRLSRVLGVVSELNGVRSARRR
ncbi:MAG: bifunctional (p)ppGpp synthetase/guanosine-3',5'-bis(diphosphate) 3'-pyrophosphohydrolase [Comamonadaceae bacterium]